MKAVRRKLTHYYDSLSYKGKFRLVFNILFVGVLILIIGITLSYSALLSDELYEKHQEKLIYLSQQIETEFKQIEALSTEIHQNTAIQNSLTTTNKSSLSVQEYMKEQDIGSSEITWLLADKLNVTKVLLLNKKGKNITKSTYNSEKFFDGKTFNEIVEKFPEDSRQGHWLFNHDLSEALFYQNIYNTKQMTLKPIGTLIAFVNTAFIQNAINQVDYFGDQDFYFLENDGRYLSHKTEDYESNIQTITKQQKSKRNYQVVTTSNGKYFVYSRSLNTYSGKMTIYYFLRNSQVILKVFRMLVLFGMILTLFLIGCYCLSNRYIDRLLRPINHLVDAMKRFKSEADLQQLQELQHPHELAQRTDEIGSLYASFQQLIGEIQGLILTDYQSKLLAREMEFKFLKAQLDPHFLYNTLNSINWLAINNEDWQISEMVTALSLLLRKKLDNEHEFVSVQEELELINAYIKIQSVRFDDRLIYQEDIPEELKNEQIPQLIIQPLIENAIKYAVERRDHPVTIVLKIREKDHQLQITVTDDGPGFEDCTSGSKDSTGLGIANIKSRLKMVYGKKSSFTIESKPNQLTRITISLPIV
jgi:two-component system sensor histidine kinase YesM